MKKIILFAVFASLGMTSSVSANEADKKACEAPPSNGTWHGLAADGSKCECKEGYFNNRRIPVKGGWKKLMEALAEKGEKDGISTVITDICTKMETVKAAAKKNKIAVASETTTAAPTKFAAMLTPGDKNDVKGGEAVKQALVVTSGGKQIAKFVASCSACNVNNENPLIVNNPQIPETGYVFNLTPTNPETALTATFIVKVIDKKGNELGSFNASIGWLAKAPPAPVATPAQKACEDPPSNGMYVGKNCVCTDGRIEKNGVCVDKPAAAPVVKTVARDGSSRLHLRVDTFGGYAKSEQFKTPVFGFALGVSFDFLRNFSGYVEAGFQFPGATKTDSQNRPVVLADGKPDERTNSLMGEFGVEYQAAEYLMLTGGVLFQALGVTAGQTNPVHTTLSGKLGVKVVAYQAPLFRLAIGPSVIVGVESRGNTKANLWSGVLLNVTGEFWNIIPYGN